MPCTADGNCARSSKSIVAMKCTKLGAAYWRGDVRLSPPRVQSATGVTGVRFDRRRTTRCSVCMVFRSQTRSAWPNGRCARAVPCVPVFCRQLSGRGCGCSCAWKRQKSAITESLGSSRFARPPVCLSRTPDLAAARGASAEPLLLQRYLARFVFLLATRRPTVQHAGEFHQAAILAPRLRRGNAPHTRPPHTPPPPRQFHLCLRR